jgi:hypothetical protein
MNDHPLRASLETWEAETAAWWDSLVRSPGFLRRIGHQITLSLESQQRVAALLEQAGLAEWASQRQHARLLYMLERLEKQVEALAARIDSLESSRR